MLKRLLAIVALSAGLAAVGSPALALTAKQKMDTCKFGANDQKLTGAARTAFIKKCMKDAPMERHKPAAAPASTPAPEPKSDDE
jgi:hypothetical protein